MSRGRSWGSGVPSRGGSGLLRQARFRRTALGVALLGPVRRGKGMGRRGTAAQSSWRDGARNIGGALEVGRGFWTDCARLVRTRTGCRVSSRAARFPGISGRAPRFNGTSDEYADAGRDTAFRLVGSMTIAAWISAASFPVDDAVIVSTLEHIEDVGFGWQLDTTVDCGPRVIGFKLAGECGTLISRYGATALQPNAWYHVAAVYDAASRTHGRVLEREARRRRSRRDCRRPSSKLHEAPPHRQARRSDLDSNFQG